MITERQYVISLAVTLVRKASGSYLLNLQCTSARDVNEAYCNSNYGGSVATYPAWPGELGTARAARRSPLASLKYSAGLHLLA